MTHKRIIRSATMRAHYLVGNAYEGCGHRHTSMITALKCLARFKRTTQARYSVYRITYSRRKNQRGQVTQWVRKAERLEVGEPDRTPQDVAVSENGHSEAGKPTA